MNAPNVIHLQIGDGVPVDAKWEDLDHSEVTWSVDSVYQNDIRYIHADKINKVIDYYEAALLEAFPSGATGEVFHNWNEARKLLRSEE